LGLKAVTFTDAVELLQKGGVLVAVLFAVWALVTGKVVTRREFDRLAAQCEIMQKKIEEANAELVKQSSTNARLVELSLLQRAEAESIRRDAPHREEVQGGR
jgi:hypothetical protein